MPIELLDIETERLMEAFLNRDPVNVSAIKRGEYPFISEDGVRILIANLLETKTDDTRYNLDNTFVTWDQKKQALNQPYQFLNLQQCLIKIGRLKPGEDAKLIVGMDFPSETKIQGLGHSVSIYIRNIAGVLKVFIDDPSRGLTFKNSSSHEIVNVIKDYANSHALPYRIIIIATTLQKDHHTCSVFAYLSTRYYMKHGNELFGEIDKPENLFLYNGSFSGVKDKNIFFLKADKLPLL